MLAAQVFAVAIFIGMFIMIVLDKIERHYVTLGSGILTLVIVFGICMRDGSAIVNTLAFKQFFTKDFWYQVTESESSGINWATILFIAGMMLMVEGMAKAGFFRWLCMKIAFIVKCKTVPIFITFTIMAAFLSMFIDSITVIMFLAAVTVELAQLLKFNPVPMILSEIFCANLGGSATMCGDPPNIIIGTSLGFSFFDFLGNTGVVAGISLLVVIFFLYFAFRKELVAKAGEKPDVSKLPDPSEAIKNKKDFVISSIIFACAVILLVTHGSTHLTVATIGLFIAFLTLITSGKHALELLKKVDYKTLVFFIGLFIVVSGLEETKILDIIADFIEDISGGNKHLMIIIIIWVSAVASAFVDNIPFAATMVPVIKNLAAASGLPISTLAWALAIGTDIGGSATPIGASANVVGTSVAARNGYPIGWGRYCKKLAPATILVLLISTVYLFVRYL
ncbi:possible tyrosine transporter P-protein (TC 2.A.45.2.1) [Eubacterium uniforme]|uniref:Possible tyrosine transporter P-protein (TC 2.A.45.2.1) n=1 Tax=Eubacterium uniforme TaxID=39495 RepID=A0A1T4VGK0_9FIRM|nr:SLC13 family permease [Eubacterium uniforme]SKA64084.1 possible tyrosine transporter P-protein (TC 2.A.45.2.1) [Eubacterium uniforme]